MGRVDGRETVEAEATVIRLLPGDCRARLAELAEKSVHTVCSSPPYMGLRNYNLAPVDWPDGWSGVLGSEPTVELYVSHIVEVFRSVKRVLRDDGLCFINLGDSRGGYHGNSKVPDDEAPSNKPGYIENMRPSMVGNGLKPLDLMGIPWRVALALQADGWTLRADIIWHKTSAMPESVHGTYWQRHRVKVTSERHRDRIAGAEAGVTGMRNHSGTNYENEVDWADCPGCAVCSPNGGYVLRRGSWRPTESHEYVFLFAKGPGYYADGEALKEALQESSVSRVQSGWSSDHRSIGHINTERMGERFAPASGRNARPVWTIGPEPLSIAICPQGHYFEHATGHTCPYCKGKLTSHFAAYPTELAARCIKAGTSERGVCPQCGAPWARVLDIGDLVPDSPSYRPRGLPSPDNLINRGMTLPGSNPNHHYQSQTLDWRSTCTCNAGEPRPATVLDPFIGSGSTALAADRLGRDCIGIDASESYLALAQARIKAACPMFAEVVR